MIHQTRIHAFGNGAFQIFYCATSELNKMKSFLISSGFTISHCEAL